MSLYLDASVIVPVVVEEPASPVVDAFLAKAAETLVVSEFAAAETASAVSRLVRMGAIDAQRAAARLAAFDAWRASDTNDLDLQASDFRLAHIFVRRFELMLRAPDALHLALCKRADLPLVTLDKRLAAAAEALGVEVRLLSGDK